MLQTKGVKKIMKVEFFYVESRSEGEQIRPEVIKSYFKRNRIPFKDYSINFRALTRNSEEIKLLSWMRKVELVLMLFKKILGNKLRTKYRKLLSQVKKQIKFLGETLRGKEAI